MRLQQAMSAGQQLSDEELIARLAAGSQEALGPLYARYARIVFNLAAQTLERAAAEEIMQEVFLVVWRRAALFDPQRGTFRSWVMQITHYRVLNELRHRSRQPQLAPDPEHMLLAEIADERLPSSDRIAAEERRSAVRAALAALPEAQRQALRLAILEERTHEQVAGELGLPLGTAKTRIRAGMRQLRGTLLMRAAMFALAALVVFLGIRHRATRDDLARDERALTVLTASDMENLRLAPEPGVPEATHARYRGRAGETTAIVTLSSFPAPPIDRTYQVWVRHAGTWTSLGTVAVDARGNGRMIVERAELPTLPDAVEVTVEPSGGSTVPSGPVVTSWQRSQDVRGGD